ncbi:protein of unknown function [Tepidibacter aestuarii]|nr:protein of unknown function [Tepidibacter aestuarii]
MAKYSERWCKEKRKVSIGKLSLGIFGYTALLLPENCHIS